MVVFHKDSKSLIEILIVLRVTLNYVVLVTLASVIKVQPEKLAVPVKILVTVLVEIKTAEVTKIV